MYEETVTSIQVRAGDQQRVIDGLTAAIARRGLRRFALARGAKLDAAIGPDAAIGGPEGQRMFLVSGAGTGWVGIFGDLDRDLAEDVSRELGMPTFWLHCEDGLVLRYLYYEGGEARDGWSSCPSYHEEILFHGDGEGGDAAVIAGALGVEGASSSAERLEEVAAAEAAANRPDLVERVRRRFSGRPPLDADEPPRLRRRGKNPDDAEKKGSPAAAAEADEKKQDDERGESGETGETKDAPKKDAPKKDAAAGEPARQPADAGVVEKVRAVLERMGVADIESLGEIDDEQDGGGQSAFSGLAELAKIFRWPCATVSFEELLSGGVLEQPGGGAFAVVKFRPPRPDERVLGVFGIGD